MNNNYDVPYDNNYDVNNHEYVNDSSYNNNSSDQSSILPYFGIITILILSFGSQFLKCCIHNKNRNLQKVMIKELNDGLIKECSICLNELKIDDNITILSCKHYYHKECISQWFKKSKTCPLCRIDL